MNLFNQNEILNQARSKLYNGFFRDGYFFLKKEKYKFFLLNSSSFFKTEYFFLYGAFLTNIGYHRRAIVYLKKSLLNPNLDKSEILYYIIFSYLKLLNYKKVEYYFNKITERSFNPFYILLSYYLCIKNNFNLAISNNSFSEIIPDDSSHEIIDILTLSLYYLLENKIEQAYELVKSYNKKYNNFYFFNLIYLKILFKEKMYQEILNYYEENIEYLVDYEVLFIFTAVLYKIKLFDQCTKILNEILYLDKNNIKAIINLGKIFYNKGKYIQAINFFKNSLKKTYNNYKDEIYFYLSISYQHIGLLNDSMIYLKKISLNSSFYNYALFNLTLLYYDLRNYKIIKNIFYQINKEKIPITLYNKWEDKIKNIDEKSKNNNYLNKLIYFIPWIVLFFSLLIMIFFYFFVKK